MSKHKKARIAEEIKRTMALILQKQVKNPDIKRGYVAVSHVELNNDISFAKIFVSILGDKKEQTEIFEALQQSQIYLRRELAKKLDVKYVPDIKFFLDTSIEQGIYMTALLTKLVNREDTENE